MSKSFSNLLNVAFVNNPLQAYLVLCYFVSNKVPLKNQLIVSLRQTDTSMFRGEIVRFHERFIFRIFKRLFRISVPSLFLRGSLWKKNQAFVILTSWDHLEFETLRKSGFFKGHLYTEEGDLSYSENTKYKQGSLSKRELRERLTGPALSNLYSDDVLRCICFSTESFPDFSPDKKIIPNYEKILKELYKPKLKSNNIGLLPSARWIEAKSPLEVLGLYKNFLGEGDQLKLHPSFSNYKSLTKEYKTTIAKYFKFKLIETNVCLEAEMLFKKLNFFGPLSSVRRYAKLFGSNYYLINQLAELQEESKR